MKLSLTLAAALVLSVTALAALPVGEARAFCVAKVDAECPGLVCRYNSVSRTWTCYEDMIHIDCVTEPCYCTCDPQDYWLA